MTLVLLKNIQKARWGSWGIEALCRVLSKKAEFNIQLQLEYRMDQKNTDQTQKDWPQTMVLRVQVGWEESAMSF